MGIFARLLLQNSSAYLWLDKFDCVASPYPRKLHALAMCLLMTLPSAVMLHRLEPILGHVSSVWFEVCTASLVPAISP